MRLGKFNNFATAAISWIIRSPAKRSANNSNSLSKSEIGRQVALAGWVNVTRDHGGVIFIDLRDREGLTQIVFRPKENAELAKQAHTLRNEDVLQVSGHAAARLPGTENPN